ncbi:glycosyltransferase [Candidatus Dojkabacteria bacterium]|nr:glycosyltransferase [Candidatus Dojkabacteria bacterium]
MKFNLFRDQNEYDVISISHFFYPRVGGLEYVAYTLMSEFARKGKRGIAIFGSDKRYSSSINGFESVSFKTFNLFNGTYPIFFIDFVVFVTKTLLNNPNSKVIIHSRHLISSLITAILCVLLKHPFSIVEHNAGPIYFQNKIINEIGNWIDIKLFGTVYKWAYKIIAVSQTSKKWLSKRYKIDKKDINVIYNAYPGKNFTGKIKKENLVVWAAKWIKVKNPEIALKAFVNLAVKYPKWKFVVIGEGPNLKIPNKVPGNVEIIPKLMGYEELQRLLSKSKIYVNTSLSEGLSIGIIDACAAGNIPVISNAPSNIELSKVTACSKYIFKRNSLKDLQDKIQIAIKDSGEEKAYENIRLSTLENFNKREMARRYVESLFEYNNKISRISIVVPVYNEEKYIHGVLRRLTSISFGKGMRKEIIIVEDGSTDKTLNRIKKFIEKYKGKDSLRVLIHDRNKGKSQSVVSGIKITTGDLVVVNDADLEYNPKDLVKFVNEFKKDPSVGVIYGNRFNRNNKFINIAHRVGNITLTMFSNIFTLHRGFMVKDMETCYKMGRSEIYKSIIENISSTSNFGIEPELTAQFSKTHYNGKKVQIREIDISYKPRGTKDGKKMDWFKHGVEAISEIIRFNTESAKNYKRSYQKLDNKLYSKLH